MSPQKDRWFRSLICLFGCLTLTACGFVDEAGEGVNEPPTVTTSDDQAVAEQSIVTLTSSVVDDFNNIKQIKWQQVNGVTVNLSGADTPTAQFTAPVVSVPEGPQVLTFVLTATDNFDEQVERTVNITVNPVNALPVANDDTLSVIEDTPKNVNVVENDHDNVDGAIDPSTIQIVSQPAHGDVDVNADGTVTYRPSLNYFGSDGFGYTVKDNETATSNVAMVHISVAAVNDPPLAVNDPMTQVSYTVSEAGILSMVSANGVLANDTDVDNDPLSAILVSGPTHAAGFSLNSDGSFIYTHDGSETLADSFSYRNTDGDLGSNVATAMITINPVNDAPVITPGQVFAVNEHSPVGLIVGTVVATDAEGAATITGFNITGGNIGGAFAISSTGVLSVNATAALDFETNPIFSLAVTATDGVDTSVAETVVINLNEIPKVSMLATPKILVEGQASTVSLILDKSVAFDVDVALEFSGDAVVGDYTLSGAINPQTGIVTITAFTTQADFNVVVVSDGASEPGGEEFTIEIAGVTNGEEAGVQAETLFFYDGTTTCQDIMIGGRSKGDDTYQVPVEITDPPTVMNIYCDMTTDGGGWTLVLNYLHAGGTTPSLEVKENSLPLLGSSSLGTDESNNNEFWGHASNGLLNALSFSEVRFFGTSSAHNRVIHFKMDDSDTITYFKTGTGSMQDFMLESTVTTFGDHTAISLPNLTDSYQADQGNMAMTEAPFSMLGIANWNIGGTDGGWEVDDITGDGANDTIHRIWIR